MGAAAPIVVSGQWEEGCYLIEKKALMQLGVGSGGGIR